jgi:hypothetical protein
MDWKCKQQQFLDQLRGRTIRNVRLSDGHGHQFLIEFEPVGDNYEPSLYVCTLASAKFFKRVKDSMKVKPDQLYLRIDDKDNPAWAEWTTKKE